MNATFWVVVLLVVMALVFDFLNGMNDAANSIATVVSTRVLSPRFAVFWAAFWNFAAAFLLGVGVAKTIGKGIIDPAIVNSTLIFATLAGAILWTYICTHYGLPISVSHALIGGLIGPALVKGGVEALIIPGILKVVAFIFVAPMMGLFFGFINMTTIYWVFQKWPPQKVDFIFRKLQVLSAALYSIGHGSNDAQKTMGIIAILLYSNGFMTGGFHIPVWVVFACYTMIALGTMMGGWKVVETMGMRITKLQPTGGFSAESGGGVIILLMSGLGIPVSTTHTITGAIAGAGSVKRLSAVRWNITGKILWAWILTIPLAAIMSGLIYSVVDVAKKFIF
ncbi:MAG: inorganic phosphate transporter [Endomicrobiales bacterium]|nr:inorganic phosphate transporter [Endomicrobiales bacterium]